MNCRSALGWALVGRETGTAGEAAGCIAIQLTVYICDKGTLRVHRIVCVCESTGQLVKFSCV